MKLTLDHKIDPSVALWLDHLLVNQGSGFLTYSGDFRENVSPISGFSTYAAPHRQFVYDYGVSGAVVPSGVSVGSTFTPTGSGLALDYNQGAALFNSVQSQTVSTQYSYKECNTYFTFDNEETVLFENRFVVNPRNGPSFTEVNATDIVVPCIFIKSSAGKNEIISFEKCALTTINVRLICICDSPYLYRAITSLLRDQKELHLPIFDPSEMPFDMYGSLKSPFNYEVTRSAIQADAGRLCYVREVNISDFQDRLNAKIGPRIFGGFVDIKLEIARYPYVS